MTAQHPTPSAPDPLEVARARAEYGDATRDLRALQAAARGSAGADLRRRVGEAQDRVTRAAARLAKLTGQTA